MLLLVGLALLDAAQAQAAPVRTPEEAALFETDARRTKAVNSGDMAALEELLHPDLWVNAPNNTIIDRAEVMRLARIGEINYDEVGREILKVVVSGDVGLVMGREIIALRVGSEQAKRLGVGHRLERRYTNVYRRENGRWRNVARHAHVVQSSPPPG